MILNGVAVCGGTACAPLFILRPSVPVLDIELLGEVEDWAQRLESAVVAARADLAELIATAAAKLGPDEAAIFEAQLMLLDDEEWRGEIDRLVTTGVAAPTAVRDVSDQFAAELQALDDEYLQARSADILDVGHRVLRQLGAVADSRLPTLADGEVVLAAAELSPSDTVGLDPLLVRGIVTEGGTRTSHAAIVARQLGIPAIVSVRGLLEAADEGVLCAVDGDAGMCQIDPDPDVVTRHRVVRAEVPIRSEQIYTLDGVQVAVCANAATAAEVALAVSRGADGVGLFRTELLLADPRFLLDEERQVRAYSEAASAADGRPLVFRTFDVGADKPVEGLSMVAEDNPFLGLRGVRLCLDRVEVFRTQLRALARTAQTHPNVEVMIPMISGLDELDAVYSLIADLGIDVRLKVGAMVEVPSAVMLARELAACCDFLSVGTNDLTAYVLAADRGNAALGHLYNELHPAVLRMLSTVLAAGRERQIRVGVCGELAGDLRAMPLLIGLGLRSFSVAPSLIPALKQAISELAMGRAEELAQLALRASRVAEVEKLVGASA